MRRLTFLLLALVTLSVQAREVIKIGVIVPITGNEAFYGEAIRNAIQMRAEEYANTQNRKFDLKLIFEDDATETQKIAIATKKLIFIDKVDVLFAAFGRRASIAGPLCEAQGIPMITFGTWQTVFSKDPKVTFTVGSVMEPEVDLWVEAVKALGYKKLCYVAWNAPDGVTMTEYLKERLPKEGIEILAMDKYSDEVRDFRTSLLKLKDKNPDAVLSIVFPPQSQIIFKQWSELGATAPMLTIEGLDGIADQTAVEGHWHVSLAQADKVWTQRYTAAWKVEPQYGSAFAYDGLSLVMNSFEKWSSTGKPKGLWVAEQMRAMQPTDGACGRLVMRPDGIVSAPAQLYRIQNHQAIQTTVAELVQLKANGTLYIATPLKSAK